MSDSVQVLHLLCKHAKSRNPVSRRTGGSTSNVTVESATKELQEYLTKFKKNSGSELEQSFRKACKERSDCGSFANEGDLGSFGKGQMQKPFEDASFALAVGCLSDIVQTDSGSHLILRLK